MTTLRTPWLLAAWLAAACGGTSRTSGGAGESGGDAGRTIGTSGASASASGGRPSASSGGTSATGGGTRATGGGSGVSGATGGGSGASAAGGKSNGGGSGGLAANAGTAGAPKPPVGGAPGSGGGGTSSAGKAGGGAPSGGGGASNLGGVGASAGETPGLGGFSGAPDDVARVGASLTLSPPSSTQVPNLGSRSCTAGESSGFTYVLGQPTPGGTLGDGEGETRANCVLEADGSFTASGSGTDTNSNKPINFTVSAAINDVADPSQNPGSLTFFSRDTLQLTTLVGFPSCTFGPVATLKSGAILTDFDCPLIGGIDDTTSGCKVHGTIAFEYCETTEPLPGGF